MGNQTFHTNLSVRAKIVLWSVKNAGLLGLAFLKSCTHKSTLSLRQKTAETPKQKKKCPINIFSRFLTVGKPYKGFSLKPENRLKMSRFWAKIFILLVKISDSKSKMDNRKEICSMRNTSLSSAQCNYMLEWPCGGLNELTKISQQAEQDNEHGVSAKRRV